MNLLFAIIISLVLISGCGKTAGIDSPDVGLENTDTPALTASSKSISEVGYSTSNLPVPEVTKQWVLSGNLPKGLYDHASALWNDYLYVSGGFGPGPYVNTNEIYIFRVLPDKTVNMYAVSSIPEKNLVFGKGEKAKVVGIDGHSMIIFNNTLYIIGGKFQYVRTDCYPVSDAPCFTPTPTAWNKNIFYASINPDGTLSTWHEMPLPDAVGPYTTGVTEVDGYLYIIGGWDGEKNTGTVISAPFLPNGGLGEWHSEFSLPIGLSKHAVSASGRFIYVTGGSTGEAAQFSYAQGYSNKVYFATVQRDHSIDGWKSIEPLPDLWIDHKLIAAGKKLFITGGRNVNEYYDYTGDYYDYLIHDTILSAQINDDGTLGAWTYYSTMPIPVVRHSVSANKDGMFVIGGASGQDINQISCISGVCSAPYVRESSIFFLGLD
ncbi:MAG: hypothetical protein HZA08_01570 [Nitrospirae bacterium]|nr:hypothetical protein [Nitrospirota bacterium]